MEAELKRIAEEVAHEKDKRGGVGPEDGDVRKPQEPREQEAVVRTKCLYCKRDSTARPRNALKHPVVVEREYGNCRRAEKDSDNGSCRARARQENRSRHDKRTPSHGVAEGESDNHQRRQVGAEFRD